MKTVFRRQLEGEEVARQVPLNTEAEESTALEAVTRQPAKTQHTVEN
jgi:hypothetical protein